MSGALQEIKLVDLSPSPFQARTTFDADKLQELADSIKVSGVVQPIIGRKVNGGIEIVAGERRARAAKLAGVKTVPVIVRELTDTEAAEEALIENDQRADLNDIERAASYRKLRDLNPAKFTVEHIAERIGKKPATVYLLLKLNDLIPEGQELLRDGTLDAGHGALIARLSEPDQKDAVKWVRAFVAQRKHWDHAQRSPSVQDVKGWIKQNVKLDLFGPAVAEHQPKVAAKLAALKEKGVPVAELSRDWLTPQKEKELAVIGTNNYREAGKKKCDHTRVGAFVMGGEDVQLADICTEKKCKTHWPELARQRQQNLGAARQKKESPAAKEKRLKAEAAAKAKREREERLEPVVIERIVLATTKMDRAILNHLVAENIGAYAVAQWKELLAKIGVKVALHAFDAKAAAALNDKQLAQVAQLAVIASALDGGYGRADSSLVALAKAHKIDLKKLDAELQKAAEKDAAEASAKKAGTKARSKKR